MDLTLTSSLEDYLETILVLLADRPYARVRDIAEARGVKPASVTPALRRLADMGLVNHARREYVTLTDDGTEEARRVYARHNLLKRFFGEVLRMDEENAEQEACAVEHSISNEGMERMVRFFEFLSACPENRDFLTRFHDCILMSDCAAGSTADMAACAGGCSKACTLQSKGPIRMSGRGLQSICDLEPGQAGTISRVAASGAVRQRLLDMGILPDMKVTLERVAPAGEPVWVALEGTQIALRRKEAAAVLLSETFPS